MRLFTKFGFTRVLMEEAGDGGNGAAGVEAPAAAPAAPAPAPTAGKENEPAAPQEPTKGVFNETGNQKVDYALGVIGGAGIGQDHPAVLAAVESGDFSMLQHSLEAAGVPGAAGLVTMLEAEYKADFERGEEVVKGIQADVAQIAGGEEQWNEVAGFIRDNGTEEELGVLREMLGNPTMHKIAATYMTTLYHQAGGDATPQHNVEGQGYQHRPAPATNNSPVSRQEFSAESDKLYRKYGDKYDQTPEYRQLAARLTR